MLSQKHGGGQEVLGQASSKDGSCSPEWYSQCCMSSGLPVMRVGASLMLCYVEQCYEYGTTAILFREKYVVAARNHRLVSVSVTTLL